MTEQSMSEDQVLGSVLRQLELPLPGLIALKTEKQTPAEQRARVELAERALWGASVVMSAALNIPPRARPTAADQPSDVECAWWRLHDAMEEVRRGWSEDMRAEWDADRHNRRSSIYTRVALKMRQSLGLVVEDGTELYGHSAQVATDESPKIKYEIDARWSRSMGFIEVRDPFTGEWHEIETKQAHQNWKTMANENKRKAVERAQARR